MNLDLRHAVEGTDRCECGNCDWKGTVAEVSEITAAEQRLSPGDPLPIGDCPQCKALCYLSFDKAIEQSS